MKLKLLGNTSLTETIIKFLEIVLHLFEIPNPKPKEITQYFFLITSGISVFYYFNNYGNSMVLNPSCLDFFLEQATLVIKL